MNIQISTTPLSLSSSLSKSQNRFSVNSKKSRYRILHHAVAELLETLVLLQSAVIVAAAAAVVGVAVVATEVLGVIGVV